VFERQRAHECLPVPTGCAIRSPHGVQTQPLGESYHAGSTALPLARTPPSASSEDGLSPELLAAVAAVESLADDDLWHLARKALSPEASRELEALHLKQRDDGLSREEDDRRAKLVQEYERTMLIRAQAARLLKDRGHDISGLLAAR
jgi:hypothetical protein